MHVIQTIPMFDDKRSADLEETPRRWSGPETEKQEADAECMLLAITTERRRRKDQADEQRQRLAIEVVAKVKDMGLFERVRLASPRWSRSSGIWRS